MRLKHLPIKENSKSDLSFIFTDKTKDITVTLIYDGVCHVDLNLDVQKNHNISLLYKLMIGLECLHMVYKGIFKKIK